VVFLSDEEINRAYHHISTRKEVLKTLYTFLCGAIDSATNVILQRG